MIREGVPQFMASSDETKKPIQPRQADTSDLENLGMDELLDLYSKPSLTEGEIIKGRVVKITPSDVVVDIGYKSEGLLRSKKSPAMTRGETQACDEIEVLHRAPRRLLRLRRTLP